MGIPIGIDVRDRAVDPTALDGAFAALRHADATYSTYTPHSAISRLDAGTLRLANAAAEVREVLARCERLRLRTDGWFDVRATGRLDPSGFVKGMALEAAVAALAEAGVRNACAHAGGDVIVRGERAADAAWRIGIRHPRRRDRVAAVLASRHLAVATSGAYERGAHIVDPHTGAAPRGVLSVTVVGPDLGTADAYATAAFAMGLGGPAWTATLHGYDAMTILADGRVLSTAGMERYRVP
jgi:FAD:protein FMN transferase